MGIKINYFLIQCQYYSQNLKMNIKVKLAKNSPNRYNTITTSQQFKPIVLSKLRQSIRNDKENNNNQINFDHQFHKRNHKNQLFHSYEFQKLKSDNLLECQQDFIVTDRNHNRNQDDNRNSFFNQRCQSQQNLMKLRHSQQNNLMKKANEFKLDDLNKQQNNGLTFNSIKMGFKNGSAINNQEFIQEKKIKKQVIDQIIKNGPKNNFCSQQFINKFNQTNLIECFNKDGKKAKYRIINSEQSDQLYYCSKCSILLLQQGFQVQEIDFNNKKQSKKQKMLKRKGQCELLMCKIKDIQSNLKQNVSDLGKNSYLSVLEQEIERVQQTYDIMIEIITQIKQKDIQRLNSAKSDIIRQTQKEKNQLFEKFTYAQSIRDQIQQIFKNNISFSDSEFNSMLSQYSLKIQNFQQYQPLEFSIKQQSIESRLEKIVYQIQQYFNTNKNSVNFSFDKNEISNSKSEDFIVQEAKKPFRNLFPEEDSKDKMKKVSKYYNGQFIQENSENSSPNFQKRYY